MANTIRHTVQRFLHGEASIAPLITFRVLFGGLMMVGALRFMLNGWIERLYGEPVFFFKYYGFEWVEVLSVPGMYALYTTIALSAALIMLGLFYRVAAIVFFLTFTYAELTDVTNYLNHYYLVCLLAFLMIFLPAHRRFSLDIWRRPERRLTQVPAWTIHILMLQIGIVYFCAGFAKLNPDWLFRAMPLAAWLPARADLPLLGWLFQYSWTPFVFSWAGAFYDLTIPFFLLHSRTRPVAYAAVIGFHGLTYFLFNIGLFPFIMIFSTLIFFPGREHERWWAIVKPASFWISRRASFPKTGTSRLFGSIFLQLTLITFILIQLVLPFRHLLYPSNVLWTEEGYRFAWRVMLVEKVGQATYTVHDPDTGRRGEVANSEYLTPFQEKQMAIQPDLIRQFAHFLAHEYREKHGVAEPRVTVDCHVALNGRPSRQLIDPRVNLAVLEAGLRHKPWILPFKTATE